MTTKNFNAKKVLMSSVAAVVFSFVFTANANVKGAQKGNVEVRVKDAPKGNLEIRVKDIPNQVEDFFMQLMGIPRGGKIQ